MIATQETSLLVIVVGNYWLWERLSRQMLAELTYNGGKVVMLFDLDIYIDDIDTFWDDDNDDTVEDYDDLVLAVRALMEQHGDVLVYVVHELVEQLEMGI